MATFNDIEDIRRNLDNDGYLTGTVYVGLDEIVSSDLETFLDGLSDRLIGGVLLTDISYRAIGVEPDGMIALEVRGDPSMEIAAQDG
jgi:hypothetical protein